MPKIIDEIILDCSKEEAYQKMANLDFDKSITPDKSFDILYQNERLIKFRWKNELDSPGFEKIFIPESYTIFSKRNPKSPFLYSFFLCIFYDHPQGSIMKYIQDFELDEDNNIKENAVLSHLKDSSSRIIQNIEKYLKQ